MLLSLQIDVFLRGASLDRERGWSALALAQSAIWTPRVPAFFSRASSEGRSRARMATPTGGPAAVLPCCQ
eukprot:12774759-Heterocapsa_arctica.AAC.1